VDFLIRKISVVETKGTVLSFVLMASMNDLGHVKQEIEMLENTQRPLICLPFFFCCYWCSTTTAAWIEQVVFDENHELFIVVKIAVSDFGRHFAFACVFLHCT
jgi:hypothetical protein